MEITMNNDVFNMDIRKFLKMVGIKSQHEIEQAVAQAVASGLIKGDEALSASMTLTIGQVNLNVSFDGMIGLELAS
jgi:hypothetical protein